MLVNIQLGQGAYVDLKLALPGKAVGQLVIEAVDTLNHQNILLSQSQIVPFILPCACKKIKPGKLHGLSLQKVRHILIELLNIQTLQHLKIVIALGIPGAVLPVDKIIVHPDGVRL